MDGSENFIRGWSDYVSGFGKICREHWLGLDKIHCLTTSTARTELRIDMVYFTGEVKYARYNFFMVGNADSNYTLQVADYSGTDEDSIKKHNLNGTPFSTPDSDNDDAVYWITFTNLKDYPSFKFAEMKLRARD